MIFEHPNGVYDTDNIKGYETRRFTEYMDYLYRQVEYMVNPRRCVNLSHDTIKQRVVLIQEKISAELGLSNEQIDFIVAFAEGLAHPPGQKL